MYDYYTLSQKIKSFFLLTKLRTLASKLVPFTIRLEYINRCGFDTLQGGVRAVVYTDVLQILVLFGGIVTIMTAASVEMGGISEVWRINKEHDRVQFWK